MTQYYTLITSLPRHAQHFKVDQTPISYIQLEKRLELIPKAEQIFLHEVILVIWQSWFAFRSPLQETLSHAEPLLALNDPFITNLIRWFFDLRSLMAALRLRQFQTKPPSRCEDYWHASFDQVLIKNWQQADFNLKRTYPWLSEVNTKLSQHETDEVEDILLTIIWKHLQLIEQGHYFDRAAVILYLLRWHIVDYWSKFNKKKALLRVTQLSDEISLRNHAYE